MALFGPTDVFLAVHPCCVVREKNKKNGIQLKKCYRFQKNYHLRHRTRLRVRVIITDFTYGTEEVLG